MMSFFPILLPVKILVSRDVSFSIEKMDSTTTSHWSCVTGGNPNYVKA